VRISAKGEYAIEAMLDLSRQRHRGLVPIQEIAARQGIPQRYLEQVLLALKRAGLLDSRRGSSGGYRLARSPEDISVGDVLRAVEGAQAPFAARAGAERRPDRERDDLAALWREVGEAISQVVDRITIAELVARAAERQGAAQPMYHI
jgi:Rrf2 family protein